MAFIAAKVIYYVIGIFWVRYVEMSFGTYTFKIRIFLETKNFDSWTEDTNLINLG